MNLWLFQGGAETEWLLKADESGFDQFFWTANKNVCVGDVALIYLTAPLSAIIATVQIIGEPFFNPAATSMFNNSFMYDKWCVEVGKAFYLGRHDELTIANLRRLFATDWGWVRYPRGSTRIPEHMIPLLQDLMSPFLPKLAIRIDRSSLEVKEDSPADERTSNSVGDPALRA